MKNHMEKWKRSTLEKLENEYWGEPEFGSHLVTECHRLRKIPLGQFTTEDLRIMLGQKFSVKHLLPLAIDVLEKEPLAEGDFYQGDLLQSVLLIPKEEWRKNIKSYKKVKEIVDSTPDLPRDLNSAVKKFHEYNL